VSNNEIIVSQHQWLLCVKFFSFSKCLKRNWTFLEFQCKMCFLQHKFNTFEK
jgi:hypothetical protein